MGSVILSCTCINQIQLLLQCMLYRYNPMFVLNNFIPGTDKEPSPTEYEKTTADKLLHRRGPAYSHQFRGSGTIMWAQAGNILLVLCFTHHGAYLCKYKKITQTSHP